MEILVSSKKFTLTDAVVQYAEKKIETVEKFFSNIIKAEVIVGMETNRHQKGDVFYAECKLSVPGTELFAKSEAKDAYQALDLLKDNMEREVKKYKEKLQGNIKKVKTVARKNKEYNTEIDAEEII